MHARLLATVLAIAAGGCAAHPKDIKPVYVSEISYQAYSCDQLRDTLLNVNTALNNAANDQISARSADTLGVVLIGLPVSSMTGRDSTAQVATLKGHADAIQRAGAMKNCGSLAPRY